MSTEPSQILAKACSYCKEEIHPDAIRCKHCGASLSPRKFSPTKVIMLVSSILILIGFFLPYLKVPFNDHIVSGLKMASQEGDLIYLYLIPISSIASVLLIFTGPHKKIMTNIHQVSYLIPFILLLIGLFRIAKMVHDMGLGGLAQNASVDDLLDILNRFSGIGLKMSLAMAIVGCIASVVDSRIKDPEDENRTKTTIKINFSKISLIGSGLIIYSLIRNPFGYFLPQLLLITYGLILMFALKKLEHGIILTCLGIIFYFFYIEPIVLILIGALFFIPKLENIILDKIGSFLPNQIKERFTKQHS